MIIQLLACLCLLQPVYALSSTQDAKASGRSLGKMSSRDAINQLQCFDSASLIPAQAAPFDAERIEAHLLQNSQPVTEVTVFLRDEGLIKNKQNKYFHEDEAFLQNSETILQSGHYTLVSNENHYTTEICQETGAPYPRQLTRDLQVTIRYEPKEEREVRQCLSHNEEQQFSWKKDAEKWVKKKKKQLSQDGTIRHYSAAIMEGSLFSTYKTRAEWSHHNDSPNCSSYHSQTVLLKPEVWEETSEQWLCNNQPLLDQMSGLECSLVAHTCLDAEPRIIHGKPVQKKCWKESLQFLCQFPKTQTCRFFKNKQCQETNRKCIHESPYGCALWQISYQCLHTKIKRIESDLSFGVATENSESYEPNRSFADVYTKMSLFEELKKEIADQNMPDANNIQLFKGKSLQCSKNIANNLIYDCCFSFGGFAKDIKLTQCSEEEVSLKAMRDQGLCHYVGKYAENFLDLLKSRDVHNFCCFPSKLARVFQEEGRKQLPIGWGDPKKPNCRGLFSEEIARLDFSRIDLGEVYSDVSPELEQRLQEKLASIRPKIEERIEGGQNATR